MNAPVFWNGAGRMDPAFLAARERRLRRPLPDAYRAMLLNHGSGELHPLHCVYHHGRVLGPHHCASTRWSTIEYLAGFRSHTAAQPPFQSAARHRVPTLVELDASMHWDYDRRFLPIARLDYSQHAPHLLLDCDSDDTQVWLITPCESWHPLYLAGRDWLVAWKHDVWEVVSLGVSFETFLSRLGAHPCVAELDHAQAAWTLGEVVSHNLEAAFSPLLQQAVDRADTTGLATAIRVCAAEIAQMKLPSICHRELIDLLFWAAMHINDFTDDAEWWSTEFGNGHHIYAFLEDGALLQHVEIYTLENFGNVQMWCSDRMRAGVLRFRDGTLQLEKEHVDKVIANVLARDPRR